MSKKNDNSFYVYRIDRDDRIISVSESWIVFADENEGGEKCHPSYVMNRSLYDFIADAETKHLFKTLINQVRAGKSPLTIPFRCDSPELRRFMEMTITFLPDDSVEFRNRLLKVEPRDSVDLLKSQSQEGKKFLLMCSFCKKVLVSKHEWLDTEEAVEALDLFATHELPRITHGICPSCHSILHAKLKGGKK